MNFLIHDHDGRIEQSNKLSVWTKGDGGRTHDHSDLLNELEQKHIAVESPSALDPVKHFVSHGEVQVRPEMPIALKSQRVKAGSSDAIRLKGVPKGVVVEVRARSFQEPLVSVKVTDGHLDIEAPVPGMYVVSATKFPFVDWSAEIEVTP